MGTIGAGILTAAKAISGARIQNEQSTLDNLIKREKLKRDTELFGLQKAKATLDLEIAHRTNQIDDAEFPLLMKQIKAQSDNFEQKQRIAQLKLDEEEQTIINQMKTIEQSQNIFEQAIVDDLLAVRSVSPQGDVVLGGGKQTNVPQFSAKQAEEKRIADKRFSLETELNRFTSVDKNGNVQSFSPDTLQSLTDTVLSFGQDTSSVQFQRSILNNPVVQQAIRQSPELGQAIENEARKQSPDIFGVVARHEDQFQPHGFLDKVLSFSEGVASFPVGGQRTIETIRGLLGGVSQEPQPQPEPSATQIVEPEKTIEQIANDGEPEDEIKVIATVDGLKQRLFLPRKNLLKAKEKYPDLEIER